MGLRWTLLLLLLLLLIFTKSEGAKRCSASAYADPMQGSAAAASIFMSRSGAAAASPVCGLYRCTVAAAAGDVVAGEGAAAAAGTAKGRPLPCSRATIHFTANRWYKCMVLLWFFSVSADATLSSWLQKAPVAASCIASTACSILKIQITQRVTKVNASPKSRASSKVRARSLFACVTRPSTRIRGGCSAGADV
jgi:hypothetical protein